MSCFADPAVEGGHAVRQQHATTCTAPFGECPGCLPCLRDDDGFPVRHCPLCRTAKHQHLPASVVVCQGCVDRVATTLAGVLNAAAALPDEALEAGVNSEAFLLAGPRANAADLNRSLIAARNSGIPDSHLGDDPTDPLQPIFDLERLLRQWHHDDTFVEVSTHLAGAVRYVTHLLPTIARDPDGEQLLSMVRGVAGKARAHLEAVLHDSRAPELGAPCPVCAERMGADAADPDADRAPRLVKRYATHDTTGAHDTWVCPRGPQPGDLDQAPHVWTDGAYRLRVGTDYRTHAGWLTATDMQAEHDVNPVTLRQWAARGQVAKRRGPQGRVEYHVGQAKAARAGRQASA